MSVKKIKQDAEKTIRRLKQIENFPNRQCMIASCELSKKGYPIIYGTFYVDNYCGMGLERYITHFWNYDLKTGKYIDISCSQFNKYLKKDSFPEILIINSKHPIIKKFYKELKRDIKTLY